MIELLISITLAFLSSLLGVNYPALKDIYKKINLLSHDKKHQEILSMKIEKLTENLHNSSELMMEIEKEFAKQKELAQKWEEEAKTSQIVASMKQEEIEAISKLFGGQLEKENKKSSYKSFIWNVVFCIVGIIGGYITSKFF